MLANPNAKSSTPAALEAISDEETIAVLRHLTSQPANAGHYRGLDGHTPPSTLAGLAVEGVAMSLAIRSPSLPSNESNRTVVGLVQLFGLNLLHGTAQVGVILDENVHSKGWPLAALFDAMREFFARFPLRRLYFETQSRSDAAFRSLLRASDGHIIIPEHEYYGGEYWDVCISWVNRAGLPRLTERCCTPPADDLLTAVSLEEFDAILQARFGLGPAMDSSATAPLVDRGLDSLAVLELVTLLEGALGRQVPDEALNDSLTAADVFHWLSTSRVVA